MIPKAKFKAAVRSLAILPQGVRLSREAWGALQTAAEDEAHRVLSCLATLAESNGRSEPLARDVVAMKRILRMAPTVHVFERLMEAGVPQPDSVKISCGSGKADCRGFRKAVIKNQCGSKAKPEAKIKCELSSQVMKHEPKAVKRRSSLKQAVKSEPDDDN